MFLLSYSKGLAVENGRHYTPSPHRLKSPLYGVTVSVPQSRMRFRPLCSPATFALPWARGPNSRPLPDVAMTGKCTRECDEYGHSDACWMPVRTSPERRPKATPPKLSTFMTSPGGSVAEPPGSQEALAVANGDPSHLLGDRNRNLLNKKMASSSSSYDAFSSAGFSASEETSRPIEEIPLAPTGEYKPTQCGTLTRREVYL
ncbi:hypothetical protein DPX16_12498 [Anabarilius grahami]|uniref:Protocadherin-9 n=1 Tax=Anabarilius grahami TaxID=495550 RepID=A0A3N0XZZ8_ANAGA|nr:hypothetical protein DPX16_12498 [Anabarilius grahami]